MVNSIDIAMVLKNLKHKHAPPKPNDKDKKQITINMKTVDTP